MEKIEILFIDDDKNTLSVIKNHFDSFISNIKLFTCSSVDEALVLLDKKKFDAILCDLKMPEKNGLLLLHTLRDRGDQTYFILYTAYGEKDDAIRALNFGANHYIQKNHDYDNLASKLTNLIKENKRTNKELTSKKSDLVQGEKYLPTIFLAGVNEDKDALNEIYKELTKGNYADVFMFLKIKYPGEKFKPANDERIRKRDFFIACFSTNTNRRVDSLFHREVKIALDVFLNKHPDAFYIIPIKLDNCKIPNYVVESERAKDLTYSKYSNKDCIKQIKKSIDKELKRRSDLEK